MEIVTKLSPSPVKDVTESGDASPGGKAATADAPLRERSRPKN